MHQRPTERVRCGYTQQHPTIQPTCYSLSILLGPIRYSLFATAYLMPVDAVQHKAAAPQTLNP